MQFEETISCYRSCPLVLRLTTFYVMSAQSVVKIEIDLNCAFAGGQIRC